MKNLRYLSIFAALIIFGTVLFIAGCRQNGAESGEGRENTDGDTIALFDGSASLYTIVRSDTSTEAETAAAVKLLKAIESYTGVKPEITTDWDGNADHSKRSEILIGSTNRPESAAALDGLDEYTYVIVNSGSRLVIAGGSDEATAAAVDSFIAQYLGSPSETITLSASLDYKGELARPQKLLLDDKSSYDVESISVLTNSSGQDAEYLFEDTASVNENVRFADGDGYYTYRFDLTGKYEPKLTLSICQNYVVEVSGDNENYTVAASYGSESDVLKNASNLTDITIDPYEYDIFETFYVRISDSNPSNGWGGSTTKLSLTFYTPRDESAVNTYFIDQGDYDTVDKLSIEMAPSELSDYALADDGGLIYNPISREKAKTGALDKYSGLAELLTGSVELDGLTLTYSMPKQVTAYDAVPISYELSGDFSAAGASNPIHIAAAALETLSRENGSVYYDLNLPGIVDFDFKYSGYVVAKSNQSNRARLQNVANMDSDVQAKSYPHFDESELRCSGSVEAGYFVWFKFDYIYTGDTVLDGDGNGTFCFQPILYRKGEKGQFEQVATPENLFYRIEDDLYPGESGSLWVTFNPPSDLPVGEYKIVINGIVRNETTDPENYGKNIWGGETYFTATQNVTITQGDVRSEPEAIKLTHKKNYTRNKWLHYYEEFGSSYTSFLRPSKLDGKASGVMYLQCAPWTDQVVLKLLVGDKKGFAAVSLPVEVESDSIKIAVNTDCENYVVQDDGTRFPVIMAQAMTDMRGNVQNGPDPAANVINMLLDAADAGVNVFTTTGAFEYDPSLGTGFYENIDAFWFTADVMRLLGIKMEGFASYPYESSGNVTKANWEFGLNLPATGIGTATLAKAVGLKSVYQYLRWGDNYWVGGNDTVVLSVEDTRGWMRVDFNARMTMSEESKQSFRNYLREYYGDIGALNKAWGSDYASFNNVEPEDGTTDDHGYRSYKNSSATLEEWSRRLADLDCFRTLERTLDYKQALAEMKDYMPTAKFNLRTEGANWMATVPSDSQNAHYRHVYYSQRRNAMIPELLGGDAGVLYIHSDYTTLPYTPSEVTELTKSSLSNGVIPAMLPQYNRMRDIAVNSKWGNDFTYEYNIAGENTKGAYINTAVSVFEWMKATYEAGGIPGICGQDYLCDGYANATQRKEIRFFADKLAEALSEGEGKKWATEFTYDDSVLDGSKAKYTFDKDYVQSIIDRVLSNR